MIAVLQEYYKQTLIKIIYLTLHHLFGLVRASMWSNVKMIIIVLVCIAPLGYHLIGLFAHCQLLSSRKRNCQIRIYIE